MLTHRMVAERFPVRRRETSGPNLRRAKQDAHGTYHETNGSEFHPRLPLLLHSLNPMVSAVNPEPAP
ncbi:hypothetical protein EM6_0995 [Asticcacaulis excentricus]|uniref:Uncharacterized protein n=1 Tax=Asticcacaulis excentricus TaxID=78587 RepID=A0A3G9G3U1_9CAUL|nr:hypothetical protein EM6_0995 [Asticcacaulis excentricus]